MITKVAEVTHDGPRGQFRTGYAVSCEICAHVSSIDYRSRAIAERIATRHELSFWHRVAVSNQRAGELLEPIRGRRAKDLYP